MYIQGRKVKKKYRKLQKREKTLKRERMKGADINYNQDLGTEQPGSFCTTK
jgi:hypothetical protein